MKDKWNTLYFSLFLSLLLNLNLFSKNQQKNSFRVESSTLNFIENKGQWDEEVLYLCRLNGVDAWITKYGLNLTYYKTTTSLNVFDSTNRIIYGHRILLKFINIKSGIDVYGIDKQETTYNFLIGNNLKKHTTNVPSYKEVIIKNIYQGIDIRYYIQNNSLRFDFLVDDNADPSKIQFKIEGSYNEYIENNSIVLETRFGKVLMTDLNTFQSGKKIDSYFKKVNDLWNIIPVDHDKNTALLIDPLIYSTFIGGSSAEESYDIKVDASGNAYICGTTLSINYDVTPGVFQINNAGGYDVFVSKLNAAGNGLLFSTYVGGSQLDRAAGLTIDPSGNIFVTGYTTSSNFPVTSGAYSTVYKNFYDAFVFKLNAGGTSLIYSTYFGGNGHDEPRSICIDNAGNAYISGSTQSSDFSITTGCYQGTFGGIRDGFITKFNSTGTNLLYSTYIGGFSEEVLLSIDVDNMGNAVAGGWSESSNFPITAGAYQTTKSGIRDAVIIKINASGNSLLFSTFVGGSNEDNITRISLDNSGNIVFGGYSSSNNFPVTTGVIQSTISGAYDVVSGKLNSNGNALIVATYLGGNANDVCLGLSVDMNNLIYLSGRTGSNNFNTTPGSHQTTYGGGTNDIFVCILDASCANLIYSTYLGGSGDDHARSNMHDNNGSIYVTGFTNSSNFDITTGAFQTIYGGGTYDAYVTKISPCNLSGLTVSSNSPLCEGQTLNLTVNPVSGATYSWTGPNGFSSTQQNPVITNVTVANSGTYTVTVTDANGCVNSGSVTVVVNSLPTVTVSSNSPLCEGQTLNLNVNTITGATYSWTGPNGFNSTQQNPVITNVTVANSGTYTVTVTDANGCVNSGNVTVVVNSLPTVTVSSNSPLCEGQTLNLNVNTITGATYSWTGPNGFNSTQQNPVITNVTVANSGTYTVTVTDINGCTNNGSLNVSVNSSPTLIIYANDSILCENDTLQLFAAGNGSSYTWLGPGNFYSQQQNPVIQSILSNQSGYYVVSVTGNNGCNKLDSLYILVNSNPNVTVSNDTVICEGQNVVLTATGGSFYQWSNGMTGSSINISPINSDTYTVIVTDSNGCKAVADVDVSVLKYPLIQITGDSIICEGQTAQLTASGGNNYLWNTGATSSTIFVNPVQNTSYFVIVGNNQCKDTAVFNVYVNPVPLVTAGSDTTINQYGKANLWATGGVAYNWYPAEYIECATCSQTVAFPEKSTLYCVTVSDSNGCSNTACVNVDVIFECGEVFVANIFSPNGDGENDYLKVNGDCFKDFIWEIFNRWGERVFITNDPDQVWDGQFRGSPVNSGVYHYFLRVILKNDQIIEKKGTITLIR